MSFDVQRTESFIVGSDAPSAAAAQYDEIPDNTGGRTLCLGWRSEDWPHDLEATTLKDGILSIEGEEAFLFMARHNGGPEIPLEVSVRGKYTGKLGEELSVTYL